jgi:gluconate kinase
MVILITGASHTGKTLLAQRLIEKIKFPCLSVDILKMGLIRSGQTKLTPTDDETLTNYLWSILCEMIKTVIENQQNIIIEGCYVPFNWRQSFSKKYLSQILFICLAMTNEYIDANFEDIKNHSFDIESRLDNSNCTIENLKSDNQQIIAGYRKFNEQILLMESNYEETIENFLNGGENFWR